MLSIPMRCPSAHTLAIFRLSFCCFIFFGLFVSPLPPSVQATSVHSCLQLQQDLRAKMAVLAAMDDQLTRRMGQWRLREEMRGWGRCNRAETIVASQLDDSGRRSSCSP